MSIPVSISPSVPISGKDVSVTCDVTPGPQGPTVQWMLNDSPFLPQTGILETNGETFDSIVREKATARLTGNWTCVVGYKGKEGRASAALSVKGEMLLKRNALKTQILKDAELCIVIFSMQLFSKMASLFFISLTGIIQPATDDTKVYAAVGSAVTLPCVFTPGLIPALPVWEKLQPVSHLKPAASRLPASFSPSSQSSQAPWDKSAILKEVGLKDEGRYRCSGTVQGQRLARNIQLIVATSMLSWNQFKFY